MHGPADDEWIPPPYGFPALLSARVRPTGVLWLRIKSSRHLTVLWKPCKQSALFSLCLRSVSPSKMNSDSPTSTGFPSFSHANLRKSSRSATQYRRFDAFRMPGSHVNSVFSYLVVHAMHTIADGGSFEAAACSSNQQLPGFLSFKRAAVGALRE